MDEFVHPSCLVPTVKACVMFWGWVSWSWLGSAMICGQKIGQWLPECTEWPGFSINGFFSSLTAWANSKMTMPRFVKLKLWKSGSGSMRHHFYTWIGHHRVQTLTRLRIFGMCWRSGLSSGFSHHQYKIFETQMMPQQMHAITVHLVQLEILNKACRLFSRKNTLLHRSDFDGGLIKKKT